MNEPRILTCVYCGHEYPQDTPASGSGILTEHIRVCEKHPMRKMRELLAEAAQFLASIHSGTDLEVKAWLLAEKIREAIE